MNYPYVLRLTGWSVALVAASMAPIALWCVIEGTPQQIASAKAFGLTGLITASAIAALAHFCRAANRQFGRREALLMVTLTWVLAPIVAGLPYLLWAHLFRAPATSAHPFEFVTNCYFESVSGLTTTGASILPDIESLPRGLLLWRSTTHWLGGLGIVLLFVAVLPMVGATSRKLHFVESTGPTPTGINPRIHDTARILWISYTMVTVLSVVALRLAGLPWFNALCETFGAIATGGFSVRNQSIAAYQSWVVDAIIVIAMVFGAVNFSLYFELARGRWRSVWRDSELRLMLALLVIGTLVVTVSIHGTWLTTIDGKSVELGWLDALRYGAFNLTSMHTDTGFATADFDQWPTLALIVIIVGTLIGGSSGSTTGGIKIVRLYSAAKIMLHELESAVRPGVVRPVRLGARTLTREEQTSVLVTIVWFLLALAVGTFLLKQFGSATSSLDLRTAFTASLATLCTAGPGLGGVGPTQNYLWLPENSKFVLCGLMIVGRLEIIPVLTLLHHRFWSNG